MPLTSDQRVLSREKSEAMPKIDDRPSRAYRRYRWGQVEKHVERSLAQKVSAERWGRHCDGYKPMPWNTPSNLYRPNDVTQRERKHKGNIPARSLANFTKRNNVLV